MTNVVKFDPRRKKPEPIKPNGSGKPTQPAKTVVWTPERLAWPAFVVLVIVVLLVTNSGIFAPTA